MTNARPAGLVLALAASIASPLAAAAETDEAVAKAVLARDAGFWDAYNACDISAMEGFFTADVEFYHDQGGISPDLAKLLDAIRRGLCGDAANRTRREAIAGTVRVFPMRDGGAVYGAVLSGDHRFQVRSGDAPERLAGVARFTHLWLLREGTWKMARILSYDHRPVSEEGGTRPVNGPLSSSEAPRAR